MTDSAHLPRAAQRLLSWSLPATERPAVLGDLHEEFLDQAARSSLAHARRWYWRQTVRSIGPNLWRLLRANARDQQPSQLITGFGLFVVAGACAAMPLFALWALFGHLWNPIPYGPLALVGVFAAYAAWMIAATFVVRLFWPRFGRRAFTWAEAGVFWFVVLLVFAVRRSAFGPDTAGILALAPLAYIAIEIRHAWLARRAPRFYDVRISALGTCNDRDFGAFGATTMAVAGLALSRPVVGRAVTVPIAEELAAAGVTPMHMTIDRAFSSTETLRVVAALSRKSPGARAIVDLVDSDGAVKQQIPADVSSTVSRPINVEPPVDGFTRTASAVDCDPRFAEISAEIPLAGFAPGDYRLRISALDGSDVVTQEEPIRITRPR